MNKRFLITGVSKFPANKLVKHLVEHQIGVVGVDIKYPAYNPERMKFYLTDPYLSNIENICRAEKIDTVIHFLFDYDLYSRSHPFNRNNFIRFTRLFEYLKVELFEKLYLFSSSFVYGVNFVNNKPYEEGETILPSSSIAYLNDMIAIERYLTDNISDIENKGLFLFRMAPLFHSFSEDIIIRFIKKTPIFLSISGRDPEFQFTYHSDLINYILNSVALAKGGVYNIASSDTIRLSEIAKARNRILLSVPEGVVRSAFEIAKFISKEEVYNSELIDMLSFPCIVSIDKARKGLGYEPEYRCRDLVENITFFD